MVVCIIYNCQSIEGLITAASFDKPSIRIPGYK